MKVGFLVSSISRKAGGLFQSVRGLVHAVASANSTVSVFAIRDERSAADLPRWQPISVHTSSPFFSAWGYSNRLLPGLLGADLDVLSTHGLWKYSSVASHQWHRRTGRPYFVHPHGMLDPWALNNSKWKKRIAGLLYEDRHLYDAACIRTLCDAEARAIRTLGLRNPICVIPNGIDLPLLAESSELRVERSAFKSIARGRKILLYLGRLHPKKNLGNLIRAWKEGQNAEASSPRSNGWLLAIAGWDQAGYERELKRLALGLGLSFLEIRGQTSEVRNGEAVAFLGPLFGSQKAAAYQSCDACILPSFSEGLPMTVLEAWAYAKPVLMTPECNLPEGFAAGAALRIGTSAREIALGLNQLSEMSDSDREAMGARGRALAAEKFSWPQIGQQMRAVYEWVLGGGAPPETVRFD